MRSRGPAGERCTTGGKRGAAEGAPLRASGALKHGKAMTKDEMMTTEARADHDPAVQKVLYVSRVHLDDEAWDWVHEHAHAEGHNLLLVPVPDNDGSEGP